LALARTRGERLSRPRHILCLNAGSSSLKVGVFRVDGTAEVQVGDGAAEGIGLGRGRLWLAPGGVRAIEREQSFADHGAALHAMLDAVKDAALPPLDAVGHRLVHGGPELKAPARSDASLLAYLRAQVPLAPLHLPQEIAAIDIVAERLPGLPQVACFDTAFHWRMPERARRYPLPRHLWDESVRRYGFHGLSYEYILSAPGPAAQGRVIIAHLGHGASMVAVQAGLPLDTTMGFSPTGGFMMSTRSGDLDPGLLVYLMQQRGYDAERLARLVNHEAGLLGISGESADMRSLLAASAHDSHARQAVEMFCYALRKSIGAFVAVLGGVDQLVFTGGIGEKAAAVRQEACAGLELLGIAIDPQRNAQHLDPVSTAESHCAVRVIPTDEARIIARHTYRLVFAARRRPAAEVRSDGAR
jgi:acetate kinase